MPRATNDGVEFYYETAGSGETVAFVGEAGLGAWQWGWQHRALSGPYETLTWDLRGTGRSDAPDGGYSVSRMAADLEAVLAAHDTRRVHLVGAGLGGMVAVEYALGYGRARSLALLGTTADGSDLAGGDEPDDGSDPDGGDPDRTEDWPDPDGDDADPTGDPAEAICAPPDDPDALRASTETLLSAGFCRDHPDVIEGIVEWRQEDDAAPAACRRQVRAMRAFDRSDRLHEVTLPALVVHGGDDRIVPVAAGERLGDRLPEGEFAAHDGAGHLVGVERSRPVNDRLLGFLDEVSD